MFYHTFGHQRILNKTLFLSFFYSQTKGNNQTPDADMSETGDGNIYVPVIIILCQALLLSFAVNVYFICMKRYREPCQNCYEEYIDVCFSCKTTNELEESDQQVQADAQFSTMNISTGNGECEGESEQSAIDCVYSAVRHS